MSQITFNENETPQFYATLSDGAANQYPRAYVYNYDTSLKETVDLTYNANGQYIGTAASSYTHNTYSVVYKVFSDAGRTTLNTDYWIEEDTLFIAYLPNFGGGGGSGNIFLDVKKIAEAVWEHATPKKLLELLEYIKEKVTDIKAIVSKITDSRVLSAVKAIKFPKIPVVKIPPYPKPTDIAPIMKYMDDMMEDMKNEKEEMAEVMDEIKEKLLKIEGDVSIIDYGATLSEMVRLLDTKSKESRADQLKAIKSMLESYDK